jgi:glycosyltransferase involved in cell wall biosynthesis
MRTSIVIPTHNSAAVIPLVFQALKRQEYNEFEVVLVDDASTDGTAQTAEACAGGLKLRILRSEENLGRARARNFGIENSRGDLIVLLDSDIEAVPAYVGLHVALHARRERAVGVGALRYPESLAGRALARYYSSRGGARLQPGQRLPGKYFVSCLASFPKTLFTEVEGFNPEFSTYGGEDLELGLRFEKCGAHLEYLPRAVGYHHHLRSLKDVVKTLEKYGETGIPIVLRSHPEFARDLHLEDLTAGKPSFMRDLIGSDLLQKPLVNLAGRFESGWIPAGLLTLLHYGAYRRGFRRALQT